MMDINTLLDRLHKEKNEDLARQLMESIQEYTIMVPCRVPPETEPEVVKQIIDAVKNDKEMPDGFSPMPCVLKSNDGKDVLPVFTSDAHIVQNDITKQFPLRMNMAFKNCINLIGPHKNLRSIVINPFTHNIKMDVNIEMKGEVESPKKLNETEYNALIRQHVESKLLPETFFSQKNDMIEKIKSEGKSYLLSFYKPPYEKKGNCPYEENDFDFMCLMIREDLLIMQINLPSKNLTYTTCPMVFLVYNPQKDKAYYYAVVIGENGKRSLYEVNTAGENKCLCDAPAEGMELQGIIDLERD